jgi:hypothetical protein
MTCRRLREALVASAAFGIVTSSKKRLSRRVPLIC